ncbi:hypothetical protein [Rhodococcus sp. IEGM 1408]|uniref:hypothetical protein n=1 Tax=Rhodococcus sp. IEGM 1408 TaxID=3082220 RepID=UPI002953C631|nr:hypothetical protein [Rhodococcus sp. IEGM 1408]MDV8001660.1 hypothetical protein [Rhodococcus sp. IEGM 1408]
MRPLTRLGVAAVATALASATALTGSTLANAQGPGTVYDSPSRVSVSGTGATTTVSYTNKSGMDLDCVAYVGKEALMLDVQVAIQLQFSGEALPEGFMDRLIDAAEQGQLGLVEGVVEDGGTAEFTVAENGLGALLTDGSFSPVAVAICFATGNEYAEVETSVGGVPAGLGSLDSALTGLGSSGSVARTTGSLGS